MTLKEIKITGLIPTRAGCAVFLGDKTKMIHFFIDLHIGHAINASMAGERSERPNTHDLHDQTMHAMGAKLTKMIINDYHEEVYYSRLYWQVENEVQHRKLIEIDARPSDAMALAVRQDAPILINQEVWDQAEDMTSLLTELREQSREV